MEIYEVRDPNLRIGVGVGMRGDKNEMGIKSDENLGVLRPFDSATSFLLIVSRSFL